MREFKEEDFLMLSGIQHYMFCKRQWALIHIEQHWAENYFTIDGNFMHKKVHDSADFEKRKDTLISRGMAIHSYELGISGVCDVVEFHECEDGIPLKNRDGRYKIVPIEYKRGKPKEDLSDELQLVAQAMCLEEMFCCEITEGYLFYGETKRRTHIVMTDERRVQVRKTFQEMHELYDRGYTPIVKTSKACQSCSLKNECLPKIMKKRLVQDYIEDFLQGE